MIEQQRWDLSASDEEPSESIEFNSSEHDLVHSVQVGELVLDVYDIGKSFRWELVDCFGRTHNGDEGFTTDAHALRDGLNFVIKN